MWKMLREFGHFHSVSFYVICIEITFFTFCNFEGKLLLKMKFVSPKSYFHQIISYGCIQTWYRISNCHNPFFFWPITMKEKCKRCQPILVLLQRWKGPKFKHVFFLLVSSIWQKVVNKLIFLWMNWRLHMVIQSLQHLLGMEVTSSF
jgi:hypothetical protein